MADIEPNASFRDPEPFSAQVEDLKLDFYPHGRDRLDALIDLIDTAERSLKVCFYIFADDASGKRVRDALVEAAKRGVAVTLILDGFGADAPDAFFKRLKRAGATFRRFSARWNVRYLIRNHQKIVIADHDRAMIGGFNVADSYFAPPEENGWNDLGIRLEGKGVEPLCDWFAQLEKWTGDATKQWREIRRSVREWDGGSGKARWLIGGPTRGLSSWARCVSDDLMRGERLDMMMAYFSPAKRLRKRIAAIGRRGEARLIMAGKSDNAATIGASRSLYSHLLHNGVRIWEFRACKMHTKLIVLDDAVYLGSANFDMRSLYLNLEIMLRIEDSELAERMREYIANFMPASREITREEHRQDNTLWNRMRWNLSWFLVSVADYTVSRRLNLGL